MKGRKPAARENEIKLALPDAATGRRLLKKAGFRMLHPRVFEDNVVFDTSDRRIVGAGKLLRLRAVKGRGTLTYKGPPADGRVHKSREEIEAMVENPAAMRMVLERLGYEIIFRYEKFRTEFARPGESGIAMLDETPIGLFLELEGPARWIDRSAKLLGFAKRDYITRSYAWLYFQSRPARGIEPGQMVFRK